jgi:hypothetical protein
LHDAKITADTAQITRKMMELHDRPFDYWRPRKNIGHGLDLVDIIAVTLTVRDLEVQLTKAHERLGLMDLRTNGPCAGDKRSIYTPRVSQLRRDEIQSQDTEVHELHGKLQQFRQLLKEIKPLP